MPSNVLVSGAGTAAANGTYSYRGVANGKNYYNLVGQPDSPTSAYCVFGSGGDGWSLSDSVGGTLYLTDFGDEPTYPWESSTWSNTGGTGANPAPTIAEAVIPWYNSAWPYRVAVVVDAAKVDADLTNFTVYVNLANLPAGFHTNVNQTDARDIRVTKADGTTEVAREVVYYASGTDTGEMHFKADALSNTVSTIFYIYYGNSAATEPAANSTYGSQNAYDTNYKGVWHLGTPSTLALTDSTSTGANGTNSGATAGTGKLGGAANFVAASSQSANFPDITALHATAQFTCSFWVYQATLVVNQIWFSKWDYQTQGTFAISAGGTSSEVNMWLPTPVTDDGSSCRADTTTASLSATTWYHVAMVFDGSLSGNSNRLKLYINGVQKTLTQSFGNVPAAVTSGTATEKIGVFGGSLTRYFNGLIDEARLAIAARTATWVSTEYNNQNSPSTFYSVGAVENAPPTGIFFPQRRANQAVNRASRY